jgi:rod shape-determining protein MreD
MMRYLIIIILLILSFVLSGTVFYYWDWSGIKPDLIMLLIIYIALHSRLHTAALWGLGSGILEDLYLGHFIGMYSFTLVTAALLSYWLIQRWHRENFLFVHILVFAVTFACQLILAVLGLGVGMHWQISDILGIAAGIALYNVVLVPATYPLIHRSFLHGWLRYRPKYER